MKRINKKIVLGSLLVTSLFTGCAITSTQNDTTTQTQKNQVVELLHSIENGDTKPVSYINPNKYIQHNLAVKDGLAGFGEVLSLLPKGSAKAKVIRVFADGKYVFAHTKYNFFGDKVGFDIFRYEDGKIVEHWDNLQELVTKTASRHSQLDGETTIVDLEKTVQNKQLVRDFVDDVLLGKNPNKITHYISTQKYIQHNPNVKDGLAGLGEAIQALEDAGIPMKYEKNHKILGEGNFVLSVSEGVFMKKHVSFYDLFRIEDNKIVEHWDTIEEIPSKDTWQNDNGKFGF
jgi:predicted SnoaL-like aldol condensation-catalyzing enzyme